MKIDNEVIDYIGILAKLELSNEEKELAKSDMENVLNHMSKINELDTDGIEPMVNIYSYDNVFRDDIVTNGNDKDNMLSNAPSIKDNQYVVPRTVD